MGQIAEITDCWGRGFSWENNPEIYRDWLEDVGFPHLAEYLAAHPPESERGFSDGSGSGDGDGDGSGSGYGYGSGSGYGYGSGYG